ncbi:MAG: type 4a pilus biogenesis protein PilO [Proteobacteria bacterium]|nr:type 4a pilus biogenesis protein PilO [Pseudomonadota bacterium]
MSERLGRVQVLWNGLAPRERVLVGIAGSAVAVMILFFGIVVPVMAATENARSSAEIAERQLAMMQRMRREWDGLHQRLSTVENEITASRDRQNLLTLLESLAARAGVKPTSMEKRQSGKSERYEETKVEVSLKSISLQQTVQYLASIESAARPLSVKSLRVKRRPGRATSTEKNPPDLIDVTFSVSAFKPH